VPRPVYIQPRLSEEERSLYESLKGEIRSDIKTGVEAFERAGFSLLRIRDERLYREEFSTFAEFSRDILGASKTHVNRLIQAADVIQALMAQGEVVLPNNERVARELAKYPKADRQLIWKRAIQIADRSKPTFRTIQEAAKAIVPSKEAEKIWMGQLIERLRTVRRTLQVSVDLSGASEANLRIICELLVQIEWQVSELSVEAGSRLERLQRSKH
jgi:hypothetical protein